MATPWWLTTKYNFDPEQGSSQAFYDAATGRQVYERGGQYYYNLPTEERFVTGEDGQWQRIAGNAGELVGSRADQPGAAELLGASGVNGLARLRLADGTITTGTALGGDANDYSKLFEGMVPGANGYLQVAGQGAPQMQIVRASDGTLYAAAPPAARFNEVRPDNSGFGSLFAKDFGPLAMAALPFTGIGSALTSQFGNIGGRALLNAGSSLLTGGDPLQAGISGAVGGAVGEFVPKIDTGLGGFANNALNAAVTGGTGALLTGNDPFSGALGAASNSLMRGALTTGAKAAENALSSAFSATPSPQSTVDTLASATTGVNPATAWSSNTFDNWDASLGQLPQSPSPAATQVTTGQPLPEPFQQAGSSSLPWDQPAGSLNTYTEQQPVTSPAQPVTTSPASGGGNMPFFDDILGEPTSYYSLPGVPSFNDDGELSLAQDIWPTTGDYSSTSIYDPSGTYADNYLETGVATDPTQTDPNSTYFPITPDANATATSGWESFLASMPSAVSTALRGIVGGSGGSGGSSGSASSLISSGLAAAPALAAINYARNQTPFDTSRLESLYSQFNPAAQTGTYDLATGQQRNALLSDQARRQISGSSFGDQSLASFGTIRDIGRSALLNQGLSGQADIADKILGAQSKARAAQNQLYGSALYALGNAFGPRRV